MKNIFSKPGSTALASAVLLLASGCTDRFTEINTNPTTYSQASFDANYLLTQSQLTYTGSSDFAYETWRGNLIYCGAMMQGLATVISYWAGDKYLLNEACTAAYWDKAYSEQVKPVTDLVASTDGQARYKNLHQIARLMRANDGAPHRPLRRRALLGGGPGLLPGHHHAQIRQAAGHL